MKSLVFLVLFLGGFWGVRGKKHFQISKRLTKSFLTLMLGISILICSNAQTLPVFSFQLEKLNTPPSQVQARAHHQGTTYCGTPKGLYISSDNGLHWQRHPGISYGSSVTEILATDSIIMVVADSTRASYFSSGYHAGEFSAVGKSYCYYRSTDHGESFQLVHETLKSIEGESAYDTYVRTPLKVLEDSILIFESSGYVLSFVTYVHRSNDYGETWQFYNLTSSPINCRLTNSVVSGDTVFYRLWDVLRLSKNGYENPFLEIPIYNNFPQLGSAMLEIYNGTAYLFRANACNILNYNTGEDFTQVLLPEPMNQIASLARKDDIIYFTNPKGLFRTTLPAMDAIDTLFHFEHYSVYDNQKYKVMLTEKGIYLSYGSSLLFSEDNGATWQEAFAGLDGDPNILLNKGDTLISRSGKDWYFSTNESSTWHFWMNRQLVDFDSSMLFTHNNNLFALTKPTAISPISQLFRLTNNNVDWELVLDSLQIHVNNALYFVDSSHLFVGNKVSLDFGNTWQTIPGLLPYQGVLHAKGDTLISTNPFQHSFDNGSTWQPIPQKIDFIAGSRLFHIVDNNQCLVSDDWGQSWNTFFNPIEAPNYRRVNNTPNGIFLVGMSQDTGYNTVVSSHNGFDWYHIEPDYFKERLEPHVWNHPSSTIGPATLHKNRLYLSGDGLYRTAPIPDDFPSVVDVLDTTICAGETIEFYGNNYSQTGGHVYFGTEDPSSPGSLHQLNLSIIPTQTTTIDTTIAVGGFCFGIPISQDTTILFTIPNQDGCLDTLKYVVETTTSIKNDVFSNSIPLTLSPNPATNRITLQYSLTESANSELLITNAQGVQVQSQDLGRQSAGEYIVPVDLDNLPVGLYFVQVRAGALVGVGKVVRM